MLRGEALQHCDGVVLVGAQRCGSLRSVSNPRVAAPVAVAVAVAVRLCGCGCAAVRLCGWLQPVHQGDEGLYTSLANASTANGGWVAPNWAQLCPANTGGWGRGVRMCEGVGRRV